MPSSTKSDCRTYWTTSHTSNLFTWFELQTTTEGKYNSVSGTFRVSRDVTIVALRNVIKKYQDHRCLLSNKISFHHQGHQGFSFTQITNVIKDVNCYACWWRSSPRGSRRCWRRGGRQTQQMPAREKRTSNPNEILGWMARVPKRIQGIDINVHWCDVCDGFPRSLARTLVGNIFHSKTAPSMKAGLFTKLFQIFHLKCHLDIDVWNSHSKISVY